MIRELKTLIAVSREGTFAAAGKQIGLTQAAVSAQMQRLERELGYELFDRKGRAAQLNARGRQTLSQAQELIRLYAGLGATPNGSPADALVSVGAIASVQRALLPGVLARFHRENPHCRTRVLPGLSMELVNLVDAGEIDMGRSSVRPSRCRAICSGRPWPASPTACWSRAMCQAMTGRSCCPASRSFATTAPRSVAGRSSVSCDRCIFPRGMSANSTSRRPSSPWWRMALASRCFRRPQPTAAGRHRYAPWISAAIPSIAISALSTGPTRIRTRRPPD